MFVMMEMLKYLESRKSREDSLAVASDSQHFDKANGMPTSVLSANFVHGKDMKKFGKIYPSFTRFLHTCNV